MSTNTLKIAVDFQSVQGKRTGIGVFAKTLLETIRKQAPEIEFVCYADAGRDDLNTLERIAWESFWIPLKIIRDKPDLIYSPGFASPVWSPVPKIVTVHDLIGVLYPENQGKVSRFYWSQWLSFSLKKARRLIASSEATRQDIKNFLHLPKSQIDVVPLAAKSCFRIINDRDKIETVLAEYNINAPYYISVGTLEPRKNLLKLLCAYEDARKHGADYQLLIIGKGGNSEHSLKEYVKEKQLEPFVHFLGYVGEEDLVCLYNGALGYVTVSLYEGFGLPPLEAMNCGISGISSNRTSLPEVVGETALLVDPENIPEISNAMNEFYSNQSLRKSLAQKSYKRSKLFSAEIMGQKMINLFKTSVQK